MQPVLTRPRLVSALIASLLGACGGGGTKSDAGDTDSSTAGDDTFGMGETSVVGSDPSAPTSPSDPTTPTTGASITASSVSEVTGDPTVSTTSTADPTSVSVSFSDTLTTDVTATDGETTSTTSDSSTTMPVECADPPGQPQDAACNDESGCGCASGSCFVVPIFGGLCGECEVDADCQGGGCTIPNPVAGVGAVCNKGQSGDGCQTDAVCADPKFPQCGTVLEVEGIIAVSTCGMCKVNPDCSDFAPNCSPIYDVPAFSGIFVCVPDASVPNNEGCNLQPAGGQPIGNKACQSGFCGAANVMGLLKMGVCGECNVDEDCGPGESCTEPQVDLNTNQLFGSVCI